VTIAKGQQWGVASPLPADGVVVASDAELRAVVCAARLAGSAMPVVGLLGGDLCRTLGGRGSAERLRSAEAMTFPVDVMRVVVDGGPPTWAVAHVVARTWGWRRAFLAMNAQWLGPWNVAPRGHPNDGVIDTLSWRLPGREARKVLARLPQGAHLPHPGITLSTAEAVEVSFDRPLPTRVDGMAATKARTVTLLVESDALRVVV
jgi:diacylglycerol kinase family enzyme